MQTQNRRPRGTGSITIRNGIYYGKWRIGGRPVMRRLGPVRPPHTRDGLTQNMAETKLRALMTETASTPRVIERTTVKEAGDIYLAHLQAMGRKPSTLRAYRNQFDAQLVKRIGDRPITSLTRDDIETLIVALQLDGLAPKTIRNVLGQFNGICRFAVKRRWMTINPCHDVDLPAVPESQDIRFLEPEEVEAVLRATEPNGYGSVYRAVILTAAMSGLRRGELLALRWCDVDWPARRIRVRRNYVEQEFGTPKSRRGSRSVPLADRLGKELDQLHQATEFSDDDDLVFANPQTGDPLNGNALLRTFQRLLKDAGVRKVRFHDLRHTFGTRMAAAGIPMRTLQEWMGHRDLSTTLIYADYAPAAHEVDLVNGAFAPQTAPQTATNTNQLETSKPSEDGRNR